MEPKLKNTSELYEKVINDAEILWDYHTLYEKPQKSDFIVVTSHDIRCVDKGVELFKKGFAPFFVASGGHNYGEILNITSEWNSLTEAEVSRRKAIEMGVPEGSILVQDKSKNLGEVFKFLKELFLERGITVESGIFVYSPDQQRRAKASLAKQWPELKHTYVTSIETSMKDYVNENISQKDLINHMVGNLKKIIEYPKLGFQVEQEIPYKVMKAYENLVKAGYSL